MGQILDKDYVVRCDVSSGNSGNISGIIKKRFGHFARGELVDGIATFIDGGLGLLLGEFSGNSSKREL